LTDTGLAWFLETWIFAFQLDIWIILDQCFKSTSINFWNKDIAGEGPVQEHYCPFIDGEILLCEK
jgi:hypothetical protein